MLRWFFISKLIVTAKCRFNRILNYSIQFDVIQCLKLSITLLQAVIKHDNITSEAVKILVCQSKRVLSYVLDNLAYLGNYYVNQVTKNKTKTIATSVFTLYLQKFDLRTNETMELSVDDGDSQFRIKIPTTPSLKLLDTEVTMKACDPIEMPGWISEAKYFMSFLIFL